MCIENAFFMRDESRRRRHTYKLFENQVGFYIAKFRFGNRVSDQ